MWPFSETQCDGTTEAPEQHLFSTRFRRAVSAERVRNFSYDPYLQSMSTAFDFCIATRGTKVPHTPEWLHEIKYDGYRLRVERNGDRLRLITRNGYDWTKRYPWIVESGLKNRIKQFVIDGEAVILGVDGVPDFNALHSRKHDQRGAVLRLRRAGA